MTKSENVGYGKPPKKSQFKKGQSGNSKGRPKGAKSLKTAVQNELGGKIKLTQNGKVKEVTKLEAFLMRLVKDAFEGKPRAQSDVLKLAIAYCSDVLDSDADSPVSAEDQELIDAFVKRMRAKGGSHD